MKPLFSDYFRLDEILNVDVNLKKNYYVLQDKYIQMLKWFATTGNFLTIGSTV